MIQIVLVQPDLGGMYALKHQISSPFWCSTNHHPNLHHRCDTFDLKIKSYFMKNLSLKQSHRGI